jgi:hypothetical protein
MESLRGQFSNHPYIILGISITRIIKTIVFFRKKEHNIYKGVFFCYYCFSHAGIFGFLHVKKLLTRA